MTSETPAEIPLWAPDYTASFGVTIRRFWRKYADFSGRASRREYWFSYLFVAIVYIVGLVLVYTPIIVAAATRSQPSAFIALGAFLLFGWFVATIVPWLALEARRLHDGNFSALFLLLHLLPSFGSLAVFVMCQLNPSPLGRRFDAPPNEPPRGAVVANWPAAPGEPERYYLSPPG